MAKPVFKRVLPGASALFLAMSLAFPLRAAPATPPSTPDPVRGGKLFLQCSACHTVTPGGANSVGPNLAGIVGAKAGSKAGYAYSPALEKSDLVWGAISLDAFLKRPTQAVPGTKMAFGGVADSKARADIVAYLATLKSKK